MKKLPELITVKALKPRLPIRLGFQWYHWESDIPPSNNKDSPFKDFKNDILIIFRYQRFFRDPNLFEISQVKTL